MQSVPFSSPDILSASFIFTLPLGYSTLTRLEHHEIKPLFCSVFKRVSGMVSTVILRKKGAFIMKHYRLGVKAGSVAVP